MTPRPNWFCCSHHSSYDMLGFIPAIIACLPPPASVITRPCKPATSVITTITRPWDIFICVKIGGKPFMSTIVTSPIAITTYFFFRFWYSSWLGYLLWSVRVYQLIVRSENDIEVDLLFRTMHCLSKNVG